MKIPRRSRKHADIGPVTIGLIINVAVKPSRDVMLAVADSLMDERNVSIRFFYGSPATTVDNLLLFANSGIDGLIMCGFHRKFVTDFAKAAPRDVPIVLGLYMPLSEEERQSIGVGGTIVLDNELVGRMAADYFIGHGLQNFAFFGSRLYREKLSCDIRGEAYSRQIEKHCELPGKVNTLIIGHSEDNEDFWNGDGKVVEEWLRTLPLPCGVFVNGEIEAFALLRMCRRLNLEVPKQLEVLCIDNAHGFCERAKPALSRIQMDLALAGQRAMDMLLALIKNPNLPREQCDVLISNIKLVERGSTASGRGYGLIVEHAKEFVRLHACEGISVADVAAYLNISMRTLEAHMHRATGNGVHAMIRATRLQKVCELLSTTSMPISEVTTRAGYRLMTSLGAIFQKTYGMSMRQYRRQSAMCTEKRGVCGGNRALKRRQRS